MRSLVCDAVDVVSARPVSPLYAREEKSGRILGVKRARFKVNRVFKGNDLQPDATVEVDLEQKYIICWPTSPMGSLAPKVPDVERVILYLKAPAEDGAYTPVTSGVHCITADGRALMPQATFTPGPYYMMPLVEPGGDALLDEVAREAAAVQHLQALHRIPDAAQRNKALLAWIVDHVDELGQSWFIFLEVVEPTPKSERLYRIKVEDRRGWGSLNREVFGWVMESKVPADCWQALVLYGVAHPDFPDMDWDYVGFCSPEGRALLLEKAQDTSLTPRVRRTALRRLAWGPTLRYRHPYDAPLDPGSMTEPERAGLLAGVVPLMTSPDERVRSAAADAVSALGAKDYGHPSPELTQRALQASIDAYRSASPESSTVDLADSIYSLGGMKVWQEVTGNAAPVYTILSRPKLSQGRYWGAFAVVQGGGLVRTRPTVLFERLDVEGKAVDTIEMPLPVEPPLEGWPPKGNDRRSVYQLKFPALKLAPGTWRVHAEGKTDKGAWTSGATFLHIDF